MDRTESAQICYLCQVEKPLSAFTERVDNRHYNMCRSCVSEILARSSPAKRERLQHTDSQRTCYLCRRFLPTDRFTRRSDGTFFSACKDCNRHVFAQRRRARIKGNGGSYTTAEWQSVAAQYDRCPMCKRRWEEIPPPPKGTTVMTVDHIIPLEKGGTNYIANIQPLCYSCNSKKGSKLLDV